MRESTSTVRHSSATTSLKIGMFATVKLFSRFNFTGDRQVGEASEGRDVCFPFVDTKVDVLPPDGPTDTTARSKSRRFRFLNSTPQ
jgi:hypothetical protein